MMGMATAPTLAGGCAGGVTPEDPAAKRLKVATEPRPDPSQIIGQFKGTIKSFDVKNGFGFIESQGLKDAGYPNDVFLHRNQVGDCQPGMELTFTAYKNKKGQPQAIDLVPVAQPGAVQGAPGAPAVVPAQAMMQPVPGQPGQGLLGMQAAQPVQLPVQGVQGAQGIQGGAPGIQALQGLQT